MAWNWAVLRVSLMVASMGMSMVVGMVAQMVKLKDEQ